MKSKKTPWPTEKAMTQVYENKLWGTNGSAFYSGEGSHDSGLVQPYIQAIQTFLNSFDHKLNVCDLGCGDFNVGKNLVDFTNQYIGVDIVPTLIKHNQSVFKLDGLKFVCLDLAKDTLPSSDCLLVRQVLQHLSNNEISAFIPKLYNYKYVLLTEHIPNHDFVPNKDIISGQGIRIKKKSGVDLLVSPFNYKPKKSHRLLSLPLEGNKGKIETWLYEN